MVLLFMSTNFSWSNIFRVVEFETEKDMERALKKLDGLEINGKPIKLEIASSILSSLLEAAAV